VKIALTFGFDEKFAIRVPMRQDDKGLGSAPEELAALIPKRLASPSPSDGGS
jgi:hypothetical protein